MGNGRLEGKVAVVTGGASGIGLATVRRFVAEGARVVIGDLNADALATVDAELGDAVAGVPADVSSERDVEALVAVAEDRFGALHLAFANAGTGSMAPLIDGGATDWMRVVASDEAAWFSGELHLIDGGARTKRYPDLFRVTRPTS